MDEKEKANMWMCIRYLTTGVANLEDNIKILCKALMDAGVIDVGLVDKDGNDIYEPNDGNSDSNVEEDETDGGGYYGDKNSLN